MHILSIQKYLYVMVQDLADCSITSRLPARSLRTSSVGSPLLFLFTYREYSGCRDTSLPRRPFLSGDARSIRYFEPEGAAHRRPTVLRTQSCRGIFGPEASSDTSRCATCRFANGWMAHHGCAVPTEGPDDGRSSKSRQEVSPRVARIWRSMLTHAALTVQTHGRSHRYRKESIT